MSTTNRTTDYNRKWAAIWNAKGPTRIAQETAARKLKTPYYVPSPGERGKFRMKSNNAKGVARKARVVRQDMLVKRELNRLHQIRNEYARMARTTNNTPASRRTNAPLQTVKSNTHWNARWRTGPGRIARQTALEQWKNPQYMASFGELGNFHSPGNTTQTRNARIASQKTLITRELNLLQQRCLALARMESHGLRVPVPGHLRSCVNAARSKLNTARYIANTKNTKNNTKITKNTKNTKITKNARDSKHNKPVAPKRPAWRTS